MCFFRGLVSRWIFRTVCFFVSHMTLYIAPLPGTHGTHCSSFDIQSIQSPCIRPTVHLICGHSRATVGLYAGDPCVFFYLLNTPVHRPNTNHSNSLHTSDGYIKGLIPELSSEFSEHSYIKGLIHYYTSPTTSLSSAHFGIRSIRTPCIRPTLHFDMRALTSQRWAVCRRNHVFCSI